MRISNWNSELLTFIHDCSNNIWHNMTRLLCQIVKKASKFNTNAEQYWLCTVFAPTYFHINEMYSKTTPQPISGLINKIFLFKFQVGIDLVAASRATPPRIHGTHSELLDSLAVSDFVDAVGCWIEKNNKELNLRGNCTIRVMITICHGEQLW